MEILKAILLGFLQGVTEFLPISSSGHLSVFQHFFGNVGGTSSLLFTVLLHMGTLIAVFVVYYKTIWGLIVEFFSTIKDIFTGKFKWSEMNENRRMLFMFVISCVPLLFLLIPVGGDRRIMDVLGGLADDNDILVEGVCFLFTAALLLVGSWRAKKVKARPQIGAKSALAVGFRRRIPRHLALRLDHLDRYDLRRFKRVYGSLFVYPRHPGYPCRQCHGDKGRRSPRRADRYPARYYRRCHRRRRRICRDKGSRVARQN